MNASLEMGERLRAIRRKRGESLEYVAEKTGISKSFLSLVERGKNDITIGRLMHLVRFYGVSVVDLLPIESDNDPIVVKRAQQKLIRSPAEGVNIYLLAPDTNRGMMPIIEYFEPGAETREHLSHEGEEFVYVLQGTVVVEVGGTEYLLNEGDSAYFDAELPHIYRNPSSAPSRALEVVSPPTL
jgi:transcriptional regulator with XRE-family HTH domain